MRTITAGETVRFALTTSTWTIAAATLTIRRSPNTPTLLAFTDTAPSERGSSLTISEDAKTVDITLVAADTAPLIAATYVFDVKVTLTGGDTEFLLADRLTVQAAVSR